MLREAAVAFSFMVLGAALTAGAMWRLRLRAEKANPWAGIWQCTGCRALQGVDVGWRWRGERWEHRCNNGKEFHAAERKV